MSQGDIPEDVIHFIERRIDSVPHLEALLLLWENPMTSWTEAELAARTYVSVGKAQVILCDLIRQGLVKMATQSPERYRYNGGSDATQMMDKVATSYCRHLIGMAGRIHEKAATEAMKDFAKAFQFRGEE